MPATYRCAAYQSVGPYPNDCGANAAATLSRSAFGLGKFTPLVGDEVTVTVSIEVLKQD